jgi:hypothetical protein
MSIEKAAVDWTELHHAYGTAEDVPAHLHAIEFGDEEAQTEAFDFLYGAVLHQGTIYPATTRVVEHLIDLLFKPGFFNQERVTNYLCSVADSIAEFSDSSKVDWSQKAIVARDEYEVPIFEIQNLINEKSTILSYLFEHPNINIRMFTCSILKNSKQSRDKIAKTIQQRLNLERNRLVRMCLMHSLISLATLNSSVIISKWKTFFEKIAKNELESPEIRVLCAFSLINLQESELIYKKVIYEQFEIFSLYLSQINHDNYMHYNTNLSNSSKNVYDLFDICVEISKKNVKIREIAWQGILNLARENKSIENQAIPIWLLALKDPQSEFWAITCISEFPDAARAAKTQLMELLKQKKHFQWISKAFSLIKEPDAVPLIFDHMIENSHLAFTYLGILHSFGESAASIVPDLIKILDENVKIIKPEADGEDPSGLKKIWAMGTDWDFQRVIKRQTAILLAKIGPKAHLAIPTLRKMLIESFEDKSTADLYGTLYALREVDRSSIPWDEILIKVKSRKKIKPEKLVEILALFGDSNDLPAEIRRLLPKPFEMP